MNVRTRIHMQSLLFVLAFAAATGVAARSNSVGYFSQGKEQYQDTSRHLIDTTLAPVDKTRRGTKTDTTVTPATKTKQTTKSGTSSQSQAGKKKTGTDTLRTHSKGDTTYSPTGGLRRGGILDTTRFDSVRSRFDTSTSPIDMERRRGRRDTSDIPQPPIKSDTGFSTTGRIGPGRATVDTTTVPPSGHHGSAVPGGTVQTGSVTFRATLVNPEKQTLKKSAEVQVTVQGVKLTEPDATTDQALVGQAHIHYQMDDGPVIATTSTKLGFHGLKPGKHKLLVMLAGNDHKPIGQPQMLDINIP